MSPPITLDTTQQLAQEFARIIRMWLTHDELRQVVQRNRSNDANVCATHDFCDANLAMGAAFALVLSRCSDPQSDSDSELLNAAWRMAKRDEFAPTNIADFFLETLGAKHGDESLRNLGVKSPCGEDCVQVINAAATLIEHVRKALGTHTNLLTHDALEIARWVISVYWHK